MIFLTIIGFFAYMVVPAYLATWAVAKLDWDIDHVLVAAIMIVVEIAFLCQMIYWAEH